MNSKPFLLPPVKLGFSLVEAAVAMAVGSLLLLLMLSFMIATNRVSFFLADQSKAIITADKTVSVISKQLRETSDGDNGSFAIDAASDYTIAFFSDIDQDDATEYIQYQLNGTDLVRTLIKPTGTPAQYLESNATTAVAAQNIVNQTYSATALFTYYDTENNPLADPIELGAVTLVGIQVDVNVDPNNIPDTHTIETYVQLRNLNDNL